MALHYIILFLVFLKAVTFFAQSRRSNIEEDSAAILSLEASERPATSADFDTKKPARYVWTIECFGWSIGISVG
ncbi:hypothetical protein VKS41_004865 [Umbelopsis sp. WA50703]|jgi:hypothetical protein